MICCLLGLLAICTWASGHGLNSRCPLHYSLSVMTGYSKTNSAECQQNQIKQTRCFIRNSFHPNQFSLHPSSSNIQNTTPSNAHNRWKVVVRIPVIMGLQCIWFLRKERNLAQRLSVTHEICMRNDKHLSRLNCIHLMCFPSEKKVPRCPQLG